MTINDFIIENAKKTPGDTAFIFRDEKISYAMLDERIRRCAAGLAALGVRKGTAFGLLLRNSPEFVVTAMALARLGGVSVPINFMEKADRIALILNDAKAVGLLVGREFLSTAQAAAKKSKHVKHIVLRDGHDGKLRTFAQLAAAEPMKTFPTVKEDDLMMLVYTSGTTGQPKGVMLSHKNFLSNVDQCMEAIQLKKEDRFICVLPMFHSFAWTTCVLLPMCLGSSSVIIESLLPFDPILKAIWKHNVTLFVGVPQIYSALTAKIKGAKALFLRMLNPIRVCISGAAPLAEEVHRNFEKNFGLRLLEGYGLTEAAPVVSLNPEKSRKIGTVGPPLPGVQLRIKDDAEKDAPTGTVGEIWVKGPNVMKGYFNKPSETKAVLGKDGWLRTGDLGALDGDGFLSIVDRKKDLIIVKGLNVYPIEIENVIGTHPAVKEVAVVGKLDRSSGEETIRVFLTLKDGKSVEKADIMSLCRERLAPYKWPKEINIIPEMPKNALQKILKKDLRNR